MKLCYICSFATQNYVVSITIANMTKRDVAAKNMEGEKFGMR